MTEKGIRVIGRQVAEADRRVASGRTEQPGGQTGKTLKGRGCGQAGRREIGQDVGKAKKRARVGWKERQVGRSGTASK